MAPTNSLCTTLEEKVAFLTRCETYTPVPERVEVVETHMSSVFLAGGLVYKLKKPVRYEFLDFSTIQARRLNCQREVELNRRLAPDVYRGAVSLVRQDDGSLHLAGPGSVVDWLPSRIAVESRAANDPAAQNDTPEGRQQNRRVVITVRLGS